MVKHTQTVRRQKPTNCLSVFDHFVRLALKELMEKKQNNNPIPIYHKRHLVYVSLSQLLNIFLPYSIDHAWQVT